MGLVATLAGAALRAVLDWATGLFAQWFQRRSDTASGEAIQATAETQSAEGASAAEAQAEANAPSNVTELQQRLRDEKF